MLWTHLLFQHAFFPIRLFWNIYALQRSKVSVYIVRFLR